MLADIKSVVYKSFITALVYLYVPDELPVTNLIILTKY
nr:MAG TPA: hypothetical protein [Bacteriophage sp.]